MSAAAQTRPAEPKSLAHVWYRGWEAGYNFDAAAWTGAGWYACLGGAELDCIRITALTWADLLDEIDDHDLTGDAA